MLKRCGVVAKYQRPPIGVVYGERLLLSGMALIYTLEVSSRRQDGEAMAASWRERVGADGLQAALGDIGFLWRQYDSA